MPYGIKRLRPLGFLVSSRFKHVDVFETRSDAELWILYRGTEREPYRIDEVHGG